MVGSSWFKISVQDENPCKMGKVQVGSSYFHFLNTFEKIIVI